MSPLPPPDVAMGRENEAVSEFPPPPPPSGAARPGGSSNPSTRNTSTRNTSTGASSADDEWDWDRAKELTERWFRPLTEPSGWLALAFLLGSAVAAPILFAVMMAFGAITFGLSFALIGLLLIVPFFLVVGQMTAIEHWLVELVGHRIEPRAPKPISGIGPRSMWRAITDPVRWRHVGFIAVNLVLGPVLFALGSFPASLVLQALFGDGVINGPGFRVGVDIGAFGLLALPIAAVIAGAVPRVAIWTADLKVQIDSWFLGADRLAAAEQRVSTLSGQRQDILDAVASERRRIERNLHDGVQQQLVAIGLDLGMAASHLDRDPEQARDLITSARSKVQGSIGELRQLGRGLHPAILEDRGLDAALSAVVGQSPIPISVHVDPDLELSTDVAETLYFVVNEAVANVLKHAKARVASVHVTTIGPNVRVIVHDDGVGGADAASGTGLAGMRARVNAVDGYWQMVSPEGGPTTLTVEVPRRG